MPGKGRAELLVKSLLKLDLLTLQQISRLDVHAHLQLLLLLNQHAGHFLLGYLCELLPHCLHFSRVRGHHLLKLVGVCFLHGSDGGLSFAGLGVHSILKCFIKLLLQRLPKCVKSAGLIHRETLRQIGKCGFQFGLGKGLE